MIRRDEFGTEIRRCASCGSPDQWQLALQLIEWRTGGAELICRDCYFAYLRSRDDRLRRLIARRQTADLASLIERLGIAPYTSA